LQSGRTVFTLGPFRPRVNATFVLHLQQKSRAPTCLPSLPRVCCSAMSKAMNPRNPAGKKHRFNKPWMNEHLNDHWVQEAQRLGYRSRAAFKLIELAEKDKLLRPGMTVVDVGAAPGSWCQVLRQRLGTSARIVA